MEGAGLLFLLRIKRIRGTTQYSLRMNNSYQTPERNNTVNKSKQTQRPTTKSTNPPDQCRDCSSDVDSELRVELGRPVWCFLVLFAVWVCSSEFQFLGFWVLFFWASFWSPLVASCYGTQVSHTQV